VGCLCFHLKAMDPLMRGSHCKSPSVQGWYLASRRWSQKWKTVKQLGHAAFWGAFDPTQSTRALVSPGSLQVQHLSPGPPTSTRTESKSAKRADQELGRRAR